MQNYLSLEETHEPNEDGGVLLHVAEPSRNNWHHVQDLDTFFTRMYEYHQRHGFFCMLVQEILELVQFVFIVVLTAYVFHGIDYPVLFKDVPPPRNSTKVTLHDVVLPVGDCVANFSGLTWTTLMIAMFVWILKLIKGVYYTFYFWDIKQFYNSALEIDDSELDNLTWHEVQTRLRTVQVEQRICIHKESLTELDIYSRILRQQNYLVAMVNKRLLPPRLKIPFLGEWVYWTSGLKENMKLLFFWSPWAPFDSPWHLRDDYQKIHLRHEMAKQFGKHVLWLAAANFAFASIIFLWQILYAFFNYAAVIRKEPSILAVRRWSLYGRLYLRHFNELDHELQARLTRAHRPATKYLAAFSSPLGTIISESIGFYATSILAVLVGLSVYDEDVLTVEHVLTLVTVLSVAVAVLRGMTPDETTPSDLEELLTKVVVHTHYLPSEWVGQAHTTRVRKEFEQLFQYGFVGMIENILSPLLTPYILWRHIYPRSIEFVDFFRNFTVHVGGVGDVCSFAQMDVRKHGNPEWHPGEATEVPEQYRQCEDGKVEMSLLHFQCTNPSWKPPSSMELFVKNVQRQTNSIIDPLLGHQMDDSSLSRIWRVGEQVVADDTTGAVDVPLYTSGLWRNRPSTSTAPSNSLGPPPHQYTSRMWNTEGVSPSSIRDMALNATYLHSVHSNKTELRMRHTAQESTPLLSKTSNR